MFICQLRSAIPTNSTALQHSLVENSQIWKIFSQKRYTWGKAIHGDSHVQSHSHLPVKSNAHLSMTTNPESPSDVFLSYARENRDVAKRLANALTQARGWSVWWDARLKAGELFNREIERAVANARCVIVLWSHHSVRSDWVVAEVSEGWERGVLVPILLDDSEPPMPFRQVQAADLAGWRGSKSVWGRRSA